MRDTQRLTRRHALSLSPYHAAIRLEHIHTSTLSLPPSLASHLQPVSPPPTPSAHLVLQHRDFMQGGVAELPALPARRPRGGAARSDGLRVPLV